MPPAHAIDRKALVASMLACPVLLLLLVPVLSPFQALYGTVAEKVVLSVIAALPFVGVFGIIRFSRSSRWVKVAWSMLYFVAMFIPALGGIIFFGCSWAGACL